MNLAQEKFGKPIGIVRKKIFSVMHQMVQDFVSQAPFVVRATSSAEGNCDAAPKRGRLGFV